MNLPLAVERTPVLGLVVPPHAPAGQLVVLRGGRAVIDAAAGRAFDEDGPAVDATTLFDLASVTKVLTAVAFLRLVERGAVALGDEVGDVFGGGARSSVKQVTWRELLTHTSGLPAGVDLRDMPSPEAARARVLGVEPDQERRGRVLYSDVGFMLLGFAIEVMTGSGLADAMRSLVLDPLALSQTRFGPLRARFAAPTEFCRWRRRRIVGEVHDENAYALGGAAGHAGLFSTATDLARVGLCLANGGPPVLTPSWVVEMTREQAADGAMRRGLGVSLWSPDPEASSHPFSRRAYGHTGFTGTSLWIDPARDLVVALLTNAIYRGREDSGFAAARIRLHGVLAEMYGVKSAEKGS